MSRTGVKLLTSWLPAKPNTRLLGKAFHYQMYINNAMMGGYSIKTYTKNNIYLIEIRTITGNITYRIIRNTCMSIRLEALSKPTSIVKHGDGFRYYYLNPTTRHFTFASHALNIAIRNWQYNELLNMHNIQKLMQTLS